MSVNTLLKRVGYKGHLLNACLVAPQNSDRTLSASPEGVLCKQSQSPEREIEFGRKAEEWKERGNVEEKCEALYVSRKKNILFFDGSYQCPLVLVRKERDGKKYKNLRHRQGNFYFVMYVGMIICKMSNSGLKLVSVMFKYSVRT
jgi:hypothetical protein